MFFFHYLYLFLLSLIHPFSLLSFSHTITTTMLVTQSALDHLHRRITRALYSRIFTFLIISSNNVFFFSFFYHPMQLIIFVCSLLHTFGDPSPKKTPSPPFLWCSHLK